MTEEEAREWLAKHFDVSRETWEQLERYIALLVDGMQEQNLIAESTRTHMWARHIVDSAQLLPLTNQARTDGSWIDLGSGAGLPGIVVALLSQRPVSLVESRRKRIIFLEDVVATLNLRHVNVIGGRVEMVPRSRAAVISARAYAPLPRLLASAHQLADENTIWVLPKGRNAENELETIQSTWQGVFHVERSVTEPDSAILVARSVKKRGHR